MSQSTDEYGGVDRDHATRLAWVMHVRRLHRNKRMIGFAGIILGASMLMWWKFDPAAAYWALWGGLGVMAVSWGLFIYVIATRWKWVKDNPYKPGG